MGPAWLSLWVPTSPRWGSSGVWRAASPDLPPRGPRSRSSSRCSRLPPSPVRRSGVTRARSSGLRFARPGRSPSRASRRSAPGRPRRECPSRSHRPLAQLERRHPRRRRPPPPRSDAPSSIPLAHPARRSCGLRGLACGRGSPPRLRSPSRVPRSKARCRGLRGGLPRQCADRGARATRVCARASPWRRARSLRSPSPGRGTRRARCAPASRVRSRWSSWSPRTEPCATRSSSRPSLREFSTKPPSGECCAGGSSRSASAAFPPRFGHGSTSASGSTAVEHRRRIRRSLRGEPCRRSRPARGAAASVKERARAAGERDPGGSRRCPRDGRLIGSWPIERIGRGPFRAADDSAPRAPRLRPLSHASRCEPRRRKMPAKKEGERQSRQWRGEDGDDGKAARRQGGKAGQGPSSSRRRAARPRGWR